MSKIEFRAWHIPEGKMYYAGYQKLMSVLLCKDDEGANEGKGLPVKSVPYDDCELLQYTGLEDKFGKKIFEGDIVKICADNNTYEGIVDTIPDMYKSRGLHPMASLLEKFGLSEKENEVSFEVVGNRFEGRFS